FSFGCRRRPLGRRRYNKPENALEGWCSRRSAKRPRAHHRMTLSPVGVLSATVNSIGLLAKPFTVTTTLPVVAPGGTGTMMLVADHVVGVAATPLKVTVLVPFVAPNPVPAIVTAVAICPLVGERPVMVGGTVTVNKVPLLARP